MSSPLETGAGRSIRVGLVVPHMEGEFGGETPRWPRTMDLVQRAEALGFDSLWIPDHLLIRYPDEEPQGSWECWTLAAAVAASTSKIRIGTFVTSTSYRNPGLIAKMADTLDEISNGRFILGVGAGHHQAEYEAFGFPYEYRIDRFEESLTIIHDLLRHGTASHHGRFYTLRGGELRPRGPRATAIPILIGLLGSSRRMLRLTAAMADIVNVWVNATGNSLDGVVRCQEAIDNACREIGRDPLTLVRTTGVLIDVPGRKGTPGENLRPKPLGGSPSEIAEELAAYGRIGISEVQVYLDPCNPAGLERLATTLELLKTANS